MSESWGGFDPGCTLPYTPMPPSPGAMQRASAESKRPPGDTRLAVCVYTRGMSKPPHRSYLVSEDLINRLQAWIKGSLERSEEYRQEISDLKQQLEGLKEGNHEVVAKFRGRGEKTFSKDPPGNDDHYLPQLFSEKEIAKQLNISRVTLLRARRAGEISFTRIGDRVLYEWVDVLRFLEKHKNV